MATETEIPEPATSVGRVVMSDCVNTQDFCAPSENADYAIEPKKKQANNNVDEGFEGNVGVPGGESFLETPSISKVAGDEICTKQETSHTEVVEYQAEKEISGHEEQVKKDENFEDCQESAAKCPEVVEETKEFAEKIEEPDLKIGESETSRGEAKLEHDEAIANAQVSLPENIESLEHGTEGSKKDVKEDRDVDMKPDLETAERKNICQKAESAPIFKIVSETGVQDAVEKSPQKSPDEILEKSADAGDNGNQKGKDEMNPDKSLKHKEDVKSIDEDREVTAGEIQEDNIVAVTISSTPEGGQGAIKNEENSGETFTHQDKPDNENAANVLNVISETDKTVSSECFEITSGERDRSIETEKESTEEIEQKEKPLNPDAPEVIMIPEEKDPSPVALDEQTESAEHEIPKMNADDKQTTHSLEQGATLIQCENLVRISDLEHHEQINKANESSIDEEKHFTKDQEVLESTKNIILEHWSAQDMVEEAEMSKREDTGEHIVEQNNANGGSQQSIPEKATENYEKEEDETSIKNDKCDENNTVGEGAKESRKEIQNSEEELQQVLLMNEPGENVEQPIPELNAEAEQETLGKRNENIEEDKVVSKEAEDAKEEDNQEQVIDESDIKSLAQNDEKNFQTDDKNAIKSNTDTFESKKAERDGGIAHETDQNDERPGTNLLTSQVDEVGRSQNEGAVITPTEASPELQQGKPEKDESSLDVLTAETEGGPFSDKADDITTLKQDEATHNVEQIVHKQKNGEETDDTKELKLVVEESNGNSSLDTEVQDAEPKIGEQGVETSETAFILDTLWKQAETDEKKNIEEHIAKEEIKEEQGNTVIADLKEEIQNAHRVDLPQSSGEEMTLISKDEVEKKPGKEMHEEHEKINAPQIAEKEVMEEETPELVEADESSKAANKELEQELQKQEAEFVEASRDVMIAESKTNTLSDKANDITSLKNDEATHNVEQFVHTTKDGEEVDDTEDLGLAVEASDGNKGLMTEDEEAERKTGKQGEETSESIFVKDSVLKVAETDGRKSINEQIQMDDIKEAYGNTVSTDLKEEIGNASAVILAQDAGEEMNSFSDEDETKKEPVKEMHIELEKTNAHEKAEIDVTDEETPRLAETDETSERKSLEQELQKQEPEFLENSRDVMTAETDINLFSDKADEVTSLKKDEATHNVEQFVHKENNRVQADDTEDLGLVMEDSDGHRSLVTEVQEAETKTGEGVETSETVLVLGSVQELAETDERKHREEQIQKEYIKEVCGNTVCADLKEEIENAPAAISPHSAREKMTSISKADQMEEKSGDEMHEELHKTNADEKDEIEAAVEETRRLADADESSERESTANQKELKQEMEKREPEFIENSKDVTTAETERNPASDEADDLTKLKKDEATHNVEQFVHDENNGEEANTEDLGLVAEESDEKRTLVTEVQDAEMKTDKQEVGTSETAPVFDSIQKPAETNEKKNIEEELQREDIKEVCEDTTIAGLKEEIENAQTVILPQCAGEEITLISKEFETEEKPREETHEEHEITNVHEKDEREVMMEETPRMVEADESGEAEGTANQQELEQELRKDPEFLENSADVIAAETEGGPLSDMADSIASLTKDDITHTVELLAHDEKSGEEADDMKMHEVINAREEAEKMIEEENTAKDQDKESIQDIASEDDATVKMHEEYEITDLDVEIEKAVPEEENIVKEEGKGPCTVIKTEDNVAAKVPEQEEFELVVEKSNGNISVETEVKDAQPKTGEQDIETSETALVLSLTEKLEEDADRKSIDELLQKEDFKEVHGNTMTVDLKEEIENAHTVISPQSAEEVMTLISNEDEAEEKPGKETYEEFEKTNVHEKTKEEVVEAEIPRTLEADESSLTEPTRSQKELETLLLREPEFIENSPNVMIAETERSLLSDKADDITSQKKDEAIHNIEQIVNTKKNGQANDSKDLGLVVEKSDGSRSLEDKVQEAELKTFEQETETSETAFVLESVQKLEEIDERENKEEQSQKDIREDYINNVTADLDEEIENANKLVLQQSAGDDIDLMSKEDESEEKPGKEVHQELEITNAHDKAEKEITEYDNIVKDHEKGTIQEIKPEDGLTINVPEHIMCEEIEITGAHDEISKEAPEEENIVKDQAKEPIQEIKTEDDVTLKVLEQKTHEESMITNEYKKKEKEVPEEEHIAKYQANELVGEKISENNVIVKVPGQETHEELELTDAHDETEKEDSNNRSEDRSKEVLVEKKIETAHKEENQNREHDANYTKNIEILTKQNFESVERQEELEYVSGIVTRDKNIKSIPETISREIEEDRNDNQNQSSESNKERFQNPQGQNEIGENIELHLEADTKETQGIDEIIKVDIIAAEVQQEGEKANDDGTSDRSKENENDIKKILTVSPGDGRVDEVKEFSIMSTEHLKQSDEQLETVNSEVQETKILEKEALVKNIEGDREKPTNILTITEAGESDEMTKKVSKEAYSSCDKIKDAPIETMTSKTASDVAQIDSKLAQVLNITKDDSNLHTDVDEASIYYGMVGNMVTKEASYSNIDVEDSKKDSIVACESEKQKVEKQNSGGREEETKEAFQGEEAIKLLINEHETTKEASQQELEIRMLEVVQLEFLFDKGETEKPYELESNSQELELEAKLPSSQTLSEEKTPAASPGSPFEEDLETSNAIERKGEKLMDVEGEDYKPKTMKLQEEEELEISGLQLNKDREEGSPDEARDEETRTAEEASELQPQEYESKMKDAELPPANERITEMSGSFAMIVDNNTKTTEEGSESASQVSGHDVLPEPEEETDTNKKHAEAPMTEPKTEASQSQGTVADTDIPHDEVRNQEVAEDRGDATDGQTMTIREETEKNQQEYEPQAEESQGEMTKEIATRKNETITESLQTEARDAAGTGLQGPEHGKAKATDEKTDKEAGEAGAVAAGPAKTSLSEIMKRSARERQTLAGSTEENERLASEDKTKTEAEKSKSDEDGDGNDEGSVEEGEENKKTDSGSDAPVIVEASRDIDLKLPHKKSNNILAGVGSKVKHSISKVKKAITGKSSHPKQHSPK